MGAPALSWPCPSSRLPLHSAPPTCGGFRLRGGRSQQGGVASRRPMWTLPLAPFLARLLSFLLASTGADYSKSNACLNLAYKYRSLSLTFVFLYSETLGRANMRMVTLAGSFSAENVAEKPCKTNKSTHPFFCGENSLRSGFGRPGTRWLPVSKAAPNSSTCTFFRRSHLQ